MSHNTLKTSLPIAVIALSLLAAPAGASPVVYPLSTGWTAAVTNIITVPFTDQAGSTAYSTEYATAAGLTLDGVNFVSFGGETGYNLKVYNPAYDSSLNRGATGPSLGGGYSPNNLVATLPAGGVYALAVEIATEVKGRNVLITLSTGDTYTITSPADSARQFWGVTSDVAITSIKFSATNTLAMIDNFSYGDIPGEETPEPAGLLLGATGLAAIWLARRMRRFC